MLKQKVLLMALSALLAVSMVSCNKPDDKPVSDDKTQNEDKTPVSSGAEEDALYEEALKELEDLDYGGYTFTFFDRPGKDSCYVKEETGNIISDAVYARNQVVSDLLGVNFDVVRTTNEHSTEAMTTILAGDDAYDVISAHARYAFQYGMNGAVLDWNMDLPYVDLSKPWWSADMQKSFSVAGSLYTMTGDLDHDTLGSTHCLLFNKAILDELAIDYPYDLVHEGKWTFDEFSYLADQAVKDLNGNSIIEPEYDRIGYTTTEWTGPTDLIYTGGQRIFAVNESGIPELTLYSEKTVKMFDEYFSFLDSEAAFCSTATKFYGEGAGNNFRENRTLFVSAFMGNVSTYRDMESDFGVLPLPKFTEEDEYATIVDGSHGLFCVPITATDPERTSAVLEALAIVGSRDVIPAFYDVALKTRYARDDASEAMLDIIKDSRVFDLGYLSPNPLQSVGRDLTITPGHDFASYYYSNETVALSAIDDIIDAYTK